MYLHTDFRPALPDPPALLIAAIKPDRPALSEFSGAFFGADTSTATSGASCGSVTTAKVSEKEGKNKLCKQVCSYDLSSSAKTWEKNVKGVEL